MDNRTGDIFDPAEFEQKKKTLSEEELKYFQKMKLSPTAKQLVSHRVGRNDPCPCGSDRKFKKCCMGKKLE